jgi:hypothetical protein
MVPIRGALICSSFGGSDLRPLAVEERKFKLEALLAKA